MHWIFLAAIPALVLSACSGGTASVPKDAYPAFEATDPAAAQLRMCVEENLGLLRFSRKTLEEFCPRLKTNFELICMRFAHPTKDWYKACPGIDTAEKLECFATVANGAGSGYATTEALAKCAQAKNRKQIYCLSERAAHSAIALLPEMVQECLDKNAGFSGPGRENCGWGVADPVACPKGN